MPSIDIQMDGDPIGSIEFDWFDEGQWLIDKVKVRLSRQPFADELRDLIRTNSFDISSVGGTFKVKGAMDEYDVLATSLEMWAERRKSTDVVLPVGFDKMPDVLLDTQGGQRFY